MISKGINRYLIASSKLYVFGGQGTHHKGMLTSFLQDV